MSPRSSDVAAQDHEKGSPCHEILGKDMKAMKARGVRTQHTQFLELTSLAELGHASKCPECRTNFSFVTLYCLKHMPRYCGTLTLLFTLEGGSSIACLCENFGVVWQELEGLVVVGFGFLRPLHGESGHLTPVSTLRNSPVTGERALEPYRLNFLLDLMG